MCGNNGNHGNNGKKMTVADVLEWIDRVASLSEVNGIYQYIRNHAKDKLEEGDRVQWKHKGRKYTGTVTKICKVNVKVREEASGMEWRVSPFLLSEVEE